MIIREATYKDSDVIMEFWIRSVKDAKRFDKNFNAEKPARLLKNIYSRFFKGCKYFLAEEGGRVVGFAAGKIEKLPAFYIERKIGILFQIFVEEKYRNRGVGTKLINKFISWLKSRQIKAVRLEVFPTNSAVKELYKNLGFKEFKIEMRKKIQ